MKRRFKKFQLLRFFNHSHSFFVRLFFGTVGFLGTLFLSGRFILAKESFESFFVRDSFKVAFRRAHWLFMRQTGLVVFHDEQYNFTEDLNGDALRALECLIVKKIRRKKASSIRLKSDLLYIWAAMIENEHELFPKYKKSFEDAATDIVRMDLDAAPLTGTPIEREADFSVYDAGQALLDFETLFPNKIWPWYVVSGTFLGLIREGDFLSHDCDLDFGIHAEDFSQVDTFLEAIHSSSSFAARKVCFQRHFSTDGKVFSETPRKLVLIKLIHNNKLNIDLFVHHLEKDIRWHGSEFHRWDNEAFDLIRYDFNGVSVLGPEDFDKYLTENYGDWKTPVKEFSCSTGTPNLTIVNNLSSISLFLRRIVYSADQRGIDQNCEILKRAGYINSDGVFSFTLPPEKQSRPKALCI